jgi:hypothetical protein
MSDPDGEPLRALVEAMVRNVEANTEGNRIVADELLRLRAWQDILSLFFARYYLNMEDTSGVLNSDRDFLATTQRKHGSEDVAVQVESIYQVFATLIETYQRSQTSPAQERHLHLVPPL